MQSLDVLVVNSKGDLSSRDIRGNGGAVFLLLLRPWMASPKSLNTTKMVGWFRRGMKGCSTEAIIQFGRRRELRARLAEREATVVARFSADRYITELEAFYHSSRYFRVIRMSQSSEMRALLYN